MNKIELKSEFADTLLEAMETNGYDEKVVKESKQGNTLYRYVSRTFAYEGKVYVAEMTLWAEHGTQDFDNGNVDALYEGPEIAN